MKQFCLGTAMWGWSIDKSSAFAILDYFYELGGRYVDTGNNYPLNGKKEDYQKAPFFLAEWCATRNVSDLKIVFKVGSTCNINTPENDLSPTNLDVQYIWAKKYYGENLNCIMVHWDNRSEPILIEQSCQYLKQVLGEGLEIGLSGIKYPHLYKAALLKNEITNLNIQVKHNFLNSGLRHYEIFNQFQARYWAYGISVSGLKLSENEYTDNSYVSLVRGVDYHKNMLSRDTQKILKKFIKNNNSFKNLYHIAIASSEKDKRLYGYLIAPSSFEQMKDIFDFRNSIDFEAIDLSKIDQLYKV